MVDILGIGAVAVDDLIYVDRFPVPDSKVRAQAIERQGGGLTATAMVAAARLGARAAFSAYLGDDDLSRYTLAELAREGVDCAHVLFRAEARPFHSIIIVDRSAGSRTIFYTGEGVMPLQPGDLRPDWVAGCRILFLDHYAAPAALPVVELAHRLGIPIVADIENEQAPQAKELLPHVDHLIIGIDLAARLSGERDPVGMVRALGARPRACLAVTAGTHGCWYSGTAFNGQVHHLPAFQVPTVDTTGCGDVFHGAYAAALAAAVEPRQAMRMAAACAALKATRPGGRAGIPDRATLDRFLAEYPDADDVIAT